MKRLLIIYFLAVLLFPPVVYAAGFGTVTARIIMPSDVPQIGGIAMLYKKNATPLFSPHKYRKMPEPVDFFRRDGNLIMKYVPAGTYYLEIAVRSEVEAVGPPGQGDYSYFHSDSKGKPLTITVLEGEELELGDIDKFVSYKSMLKRKGLTGIEGIIKNSEGEPLSFCVVFAYKSSELKGEPYVLSEQSNSQGRYLLGVPKAGNYYLIAYDMAQGAPVEVGFYGTSEPKAVHVDNGQLVSDIDFQ